MPGTVSGAGPTKYSPLEIAAAASLALLLQGMLLWKFILPEALAGSRGLIVGGVAAGLNFAVAARQGFKTTGRIVLLTLCLLAGVVAFLLSMLRFEPTDYGIWKTQGFLLYAVMPSISILWNHWNRPERTNLLFRFMLVLAALPLFLPVLVRQASEAGSLRWVLLHLEFDVIGISRALGVGSLLALTMISAARIRSVIVYIVYFVVLVLGQFVVGERGPVLALVMGLLVLGWHSMRNGGLSRMGRTARTLAITLVLLVSVTVLVLLVVQRINGEHQENRTAIARQGWEDFQSSPLLGTGAGRFRFEEAPVGTRQFVHNLIGEILIETGVVGLLFFGAFFFAAWIGPRRNAEGSGRWSYLRHGADALFVFALVGAMVSGDLTTNYLVWVAQALVFVTRCPGYSSV